MKKLKGIVPVEYPYDHRARLRHQSLLQDYEDLQKETDAMRRNLQATKQKKLILSAEVRFLRQRYKHLLKNPPPKPQPKHKVLKPQKLKMQAPGIPKARNYTRKESNFCIPTTITQLNKKERASNGVDLTLQKTVFMLDLNQNARSLSKKDASFHTSAPMLDFNHKERIHSGKEATKKSITPFFDLNQISTEEEELQANSESMMIEEPKRSMQLAGSDEQQNDIKLSVCRNVDGSNRAGKRKISWQDQVALRV